MSDTTTIDNTRDPMPTVADFRSTVKDQLTYWSSTTVKGLCEVQTQTIIDNLSPYYHGDHSGDPVPSVETFKDVIGDFQEEKERIKFDDLTDPEVSELIALLAPHFRPQAEVTTEG